MDKVQVRSTHLIPLLNSLNGTLTPPAYSLPGSGGVMTTAPQGGADIPVCAGRRGQAGMPAPYCPATPSGNHGSPVTLRIPDPRRPPSTPIEADCRRCRRSSPIPPVPPEQICDICVDICACEAGHLRLNQFSSWRPWRLGGSNEQRDCRVRGRGRGRSRRLPSAFHESIRARRAAWPRDPARVRSRCGRTAPPGVPACPGR